MKHFYWVSGNLASRSTDEAQRLWLWRCDKSDDCSTLTAAEADVCCVGCGVVYELVLLAAGTFLLECNDAVIFKLGNAGKASSVPWRSRLCGRLPSCSVDVAPSEIWLQNILEPFHWTASRTLPRLELPVEQRFWMSAAIHADHMARPP